MEEIRIFTGIPLSKFHLKKIEVFRKAVSRRGAGIRWTPDENLHITLLFIGNIHQGLLSEVSTGIEVVASQTKAFSLNFKAFVVKKRFGKPSMIWAEFENSPDFRQLVEKLQKETGKLVDIKVSNRLPIAHATLARLKDIDPELVSGLPQFEMPPVEADKVILWQSHLGGSFARYQRLAIYPMKFRD